VLGVLVVGLMGGAAGLARCPQLVSFSAAALPLTQEAQALPVRDFQNAVFRPSGAAHETLLKASMPSSGGVLKTTGQALPPRSHRASRPALQRVKTIRRQTQQWVVLTSFLEQQSEPGNESGGAKMVLTVAREQTFSPSYAVVPTDGGWLVFQL